MGPTEEQFTDAVLDLCHFLGYRTLHVRPGRTVGGWRTPVQGDGKGWPDLFMIRRRRVCQPGRMVAAELKLPGRRPTPAQRQWLEDLATVGVETYVWTPLDLTGGRILEVLR